VAKSTVGLGLATRQTSAFKKGQKQRNGASIFFVGLSSLLLFSNIFAQDAVDPMRQQVNDLTHKVSGYMSVPAEFITDNTQKIQALWDLQKNHEMLAAENERLMEWFQMANRLEAENKALRELLNMKDDQAVTYHTATVISDATPQYSHTILVRMGENDGLTKGQGVLSHEGLIGRVIETGQETSRVLLMSDVNSRIPVTVEGAKSRAILAGTNNGHPVLDHLPDAHDVQVGQRVITSGHGGIFPYGVPVGETYRNDNGELAVRPYADPNRANHVQVVDYGVPAGSATRATASSGASILR